MTRIGEGEIFLFRRARVERSATAARLRAEAAALRADGKVAEVETKEKAAEAAQKVGTKPSTINRDLRTLRAALKRARPDFRFPPVPSCRRTRRGCGGSGPRRSCSSWRPCGHLSGRSPSWLPLTLMRLSEIRLLRREHVHLEQGVVMLPRAKAGARPVILSGEAQKILRGQLQAHESEWVFPGPGGSHYERSYVGRLFRKAARTAGLRDFHFHDLRHHGATMALNRGFTAPIVMALGGWKTERMMRRYAAVTDQTLRAAAEAVSGSEMVTENVGKAHG